MQRNRSVYSEIRELRKQLDEAATSVRKSRVAGQQLVELLGVPHNRVRLAAEAKPVRQYGTPLAGSMKCTQRVALAEMWRALINSAVTSVHLIAQGKSKLSIQDVRLPHKLLLLCNQQDDFFDEERVALGKDQVKLLYSYCIDLLDDEQIQGVYGAEVELLSMLAYMCKRREFVAYFKPDHHISDIFDQVEKRILTTGLEDTHTEKNSALRPEIALPAATIFSDLCSTCQDLGIDLHVLIPRVIKFMAAWCTIVNEMGHHHSRDHAIDAITYPILAAAAVLLRANPDLAVASLTRDGKPVLKTLKLCFSMLDSPMMTRPNQAALLEFTLRYLIVCQVAGKLQGFMPGDLGKLGAGSLTYKTINYLLECLIQNIALRTSAAVVMPSDLYKLQLELVTRLLVCAQRKYLVRHEWNEFIDATETLVAEIKRQPNPRDYGRIGQSSSVQCNSCASVTLSESPFVNYILRHLCALAPGCDTSRPSIKRADSATNGQTECKERWIEAVSLSLNGPSTGGVPLLVLLQLIGTAATFFPLGSLWTSNTQNNWTVISDKSESCTDSDAPEVVLGSSSTDLAVVVQAVCDTLEAFGGFNAQTTVQQWILICLMRLASATRLHFDTYADFCDDIRHAWTNVWTVLFRTDLCYRQRTKMTLPDSVGDLVLRLFIDLIRYCPLVSTQQSKHNAYAFDHQSDLWNLPAFTHFEIQSPSVFMLTYLIVVQVGLRDGHDTVGSLAYDSDSWQSRIRMCGTGRRSRLVCYFLHFIDQSVEIWANDAVVSVVALCLAALVDGKTVAPATMFSVARSMASTTHSVSLRLALPVAVTPEISALAKNDRFHLDSLYNRLWSPPLTCVEQVLNPPILNDSYDVVVSGCRQLNARASRQYQASSVPTQPTRSPRLHEVVLATLESTMDQTYDCIATISSEKQRECNAAAELLTERSTSLSSCANIVRSSVLLLTRGDCVASVSKYTSSIFEQSSALLATGRVCPEFTHLLSNLVGVVRGLASLESSLGFGSGNVKASLLHISCQKFLVGMKDGFASEVTLPTQNAESVTTANDILFDDESSQEHTSDSRRETSQTRMNLKRKRQDRDSRHHGECLVGSCPQVCSYLVGYLLLALSPTYKDCEFVATCLLDVEIIGEAHSEFSVDVVGGMYGVGLISSARIVPLLPEAETLSDSHQSNDGESVAILICKAIRSIRASSKPHSKAHLFGGLVCANLVLLRDSTLWCTALTKNESSAIVELLLMSDFNEERRSLLIRSCRRAEYIQAAAVAFINSGICFHAKFDSAFGSNFVLPYIFDICRPVRSRALTAVASAIKFLDEAKVIEAVLARLPPISKHTDPSINLNSYRAWYAGKLSPRSREEFLSLPDNQIWEDAYPTVDHNVITCWCVIAESACSHDVLQQVLFDIVNLASLRPSLEGLCFHAVQRISIGKGYKNVDALIDAVGRDLIHRWLKTATSLCSIPLMVTSPSIFRRILQSGQYQSLLSETRASGEDVSEALCDFQVIRDAAALEFLVRRQSDVFPGIIASAISRLLKSTDGKVHDMDRFVYEDKCLQEYCLICCYTFNKEATSKLVRANASSFFCDILFLERSPDTARIAEETRSFVKRVVGEDVFTGRCENEAWLPFRRVIEVASESYPQPMVEDISDVLQILLQFHGNSSTKQTVDPFHAVNCSTAELLIYAKLRLDFSHSPNQTVRHWKPLKALCRILLDNIRYVSNSSHIGFCVNILLKIVEKKELEPVLIDALEVLQELIIGIANSKTTLEMKLICFSIFDLHKMCQFRVAARCSELIRKRDVLRREQSGLINERTQDNANDWVTNQENSNLYSSPHVVALWRHCLQCARAVDVACLIATYDLLREVLKDAEHLGLSRASVQSLIDGSCDVQNIAVLAAVDSRFSAKELIVEFLSRSTLLEKEDTHILMFLEVLLNLSTSQPSYVEAELVGLKRTIYAARIAGNESPSINATYIHMVSTLKRFFSSSISKNVQLAASRCLGEMKLTWDSENIDSSFQVQQVNHHFSRQCITTGKLREALRASVVKRVSNSLQNPDSSIALVAADTLKSVFSTGIGRECLKMISVIESDTAVLLKPLAVSFLPHQSSLLLSEAETSFMRQTIDPVNGCAWCWSDDLWQPDSASVASFESWICRLVSALLVCYYDINATNQTNDKIRTFHAQFQRMSCMDPAVAESLFPSIVLDLLSREGDQSKHAGIDPVLSDTWIGHCSSDFNAQLSRCFDVLFRPMNATQNIRAVELAIDTLDMLRRFTLWRFSSSPNHKRNVTGSEDNTDAVTSRKARVPFGIVLSLDGKLVADACVQTRRFQSAIYYAEMHTAVFTAHDKQLQVGVSTCDISGFGRDLSNGDIETKCVNFFRLLQLCFHELSQEEDKNAAAQLEWDFLFASDSGTRAMSSLSEKDPPSLKRLQCLDNLTILDGESTAVSMSVVDCLEGLGLHALMTQYVAGLSTVHGSSKLTPERTALMREELFRSRLYSKQWHDGSIPDGSRQNSETSPDPMDAARCGALALHCSHSSESGFYELFVAALQELQREGYEACLDRLHAARWHCVRALESRTGKAGSISLHGSFAYFQVMNDLENLVAPVCSDTDRLCLLKAFGELSCGTECDPFSDCVREIVLRSFLCNVLPGTYVEQHLISHLLLRFENSLTSGRQNDANGILHRLHSLRRSTEVKDSRLSLIRLRLQEARLLESSRVSFSEAIRSTKLAIRILNNMASRNNEEETELADSLIMCGKWVVKYKVEPASSILENYFQPAARISTDIHTIDSSQTNADRATEALFVQGLLASNIFETVSARVSSAEWHKAGNGLEDREEKLKRLDSKLHDILNKLNGQSKKQREDQDNPLKKERDEVHSFQQHLLKEIKATRGQRDMIRQSLEVHQRLAMESIASALTIVGLQTCQDVSSHVYRLVSMWFSNDRNCVPAVDAIMREAIRKIPSFRFVPLVSQLVSRIDHTSCLETTCFQNRLRELVKSISIAHPYHCLIHLITIVGEGTSEVSNQKSQAAQTILLDLKKADPLIAGLIESYRKLTVAYVHLALTNTSDFKRGTDNLISFDKICKSSLERLDRCLGVGSRKTQFTPCILTKPPTLNPRNDYGDGVGDPVGSERIHSFDSCFTITDSGINQPKIVVCVGTKGGSFKQLVKGNDDTRQDAVMEQVFDYANALLVGTKSREMRRRTKHSLRLVTYYILPLSHRAGVLEWVEDSSPFGDFIEDRKQRKVSARSRYFPGEWSAKRCMIELQKLHEEFRQKDAELRGRDIGSSESQRRKDKLLAAFDTICKNNSPVFRFFFVENFLEPETWYTARMRYTRSVAVSSIVGHVLGIGDRHMSNILVHVTTGEVIHIDFGIVFELGKRLKTPETVPFRLTRNVVDGMGPLGVEGSFSKTAETTLAILQQNADGLLTILSAVVSDPLYEWRIGTMKIQHLSREDDDDDYYKTNELADDGNVSENTNEVAKHAITRVHEKLLGYEDGTLEEQQSVQSQVQLLINAARDEGNLCVMFPGWAPWQ